MTTGDNRAARPVPTAEVEQKQAMKQAFDDVIAAITGAELAPSDRIAVRSLLRRLLQNNAAKIVFGDATVEYLESKYFRSDS